MSRGGKQNVLISGASIAGPALAYWLARYGFDVTVVEKAGALRGGGYPIDIRGTAVQVADRMGILPQIRSAHVDTQRIIFIDSDGTRVGTIRPEGLSGGVEGRDFELPRGALAGALWDVTKDVTEYIFDDSIASLHEQPTGVDVTFASGMNRTFDLVVGADGLHSNVRGIVFGPESQFERYLGWCFAGFSLPNTYGLTHEVMLWNAPDRVAVIAGMGEKPERVTAFFAFPSLHPGNGRIRDEEAIRRAALDAFADETRWEIPAMHAALETADDAFCDAVAQICMPKWSKGRVALVGDSAHATSFVSGQGSSVALVSAYILGGEVATTADHSTAFERYERTARPFAEQNQALAHQRNPIFIKSAPTIKVRNLAVKYVVPILTRLNLVQKLESTRRTATTALELPDYKDSLV